MKESIGARITFLGTGTSQGIPMIGCSCSVCRSSDPKDNRLRSSAFIEYKGFKILIDAGPDFRQQLLRANIGDLDAILLTHEHKDHTGGLDDVRAINYFGSKALPIYCEERVLRSLEREYSYAFAENRYPGVPEFDIRVIDESAFSIEKENGHKPDPSAEIVPVRVWHYKLPVLGFRIGDIAYITDANRIEDKEYEKLKGVKILVINTVRHQRHISHFSLSEAVEVAKKVGARRTFLTHLSHQIGCHSDLSAELPPGIEPAYDGLVAEI
ncbi:MAG: MBL fold metallo-hydrolase [Bacteroidetes bacterium HGW-Bacteroidetes-14]|jgi:phosphoribosyl 1,2-cyclic phosphate phosphodiesterase|nr:MAG: MBL fold metallo-hydrolase [Bacteroidetes bacterium HGW-Bacteroidetes-14]